MKSNEWLCENCASEPSTLENMQRINIPQMNTEIDDAKLCIYELLKTATIGPAHKPTDKVIKLFKEDIVKNMKAKRIFYSRFPHLPKR